MPPNPNYVNPHVSLQNFQDKINIKLQGNKRENQEVQKPNKLILRKQKAKTEAKKLNQTERGFCEKVTKQVNS